MNYREFIPFRDKSLTGFNAPFKFLTGFTRRLQEMVSKDVSD